MPDLQTQISQEQEKLDAILKEQRDVLQSLNQINLQTEDAQRSLEKTQLDKINADTALVAVNTDLDAATSARAGILAKLAEVQDQIGPAQSALETLKQQNDQVKASGVQAIADIQAKKDAIIVAARATLDSLKSQKLDLEASLAPVAAQVARLTAQVTALNAQIVSLNTTIDMLNATISTLTATQSVLNDSIASMEATITELQNTINSKKADVDALDAQISDLNATIATLDKEIAAFQETLKTNNEQNADFLKARAGLMDAQTQVDQRLAWLKQKYGDLGEPWL